MADYSKIKHLKDLNNSMFNERMNRAYDYGYEEGLARGTECGYKRGYERLHKSIYGQTLEEMKEDKGAWEYEPDKPKNTLDDLWKNIKKWEIESHIDTLRNIIKVSDRSDCGIKEIDGTDEEAIMFAINALEQIKAEQEPYICDTCKHNDKEWDEEPCDGCCGNHSGYEPSGDLISRQAVDEIKELMTDINGDTVYAVRMSDLRQLPPVKPLIHCKDCKYFEYDSVAKVDGVPLIVAHEICSRWGDGCKTKEDGYCFLGERSDKE